MSPPRVRLWSNLDLDSHWLIAVVCIIGHRPKRKVWGIPQWVIIVQVIEQIEACRAAVEAMRARGLRVGLVPTMGALHEGHLSLVRAARASCDRVALTIFVNPRQFGRGEDLKAYPKPLETDLAACRAAGVDLVFTPTVDAMYPGGSQTSVHICGLTEVLCGQDRPGHFDGVTTVVAKLFQILPSDAAFFGEKDYQQLMVVKQMARDLDFPIEVIGCPIVRESDGLALSSRNVYLSQKQREQATSLSRGLFSAQKSVQGGETSVATIIGGIRAIIETAGPCSIDYVEVVDARTLESLQEIDCPARICVAVRIGACRLIDNVGVDVAGGTR